MLTAEKEKASSRWAKARSGLCTAKETLLASCGVRFFFGDTAPEALLKWLLELKEASSRWRRLPGVCKGASTDSWANCWSMICCVGAAPCVGLQPCECRSVAAPNAEHAALALEIASVLHDASSERSSSFFLTTSLQQAPVRASHDARSRIGAQRDGCTTPLEI